jgi:molybdate transport system substrate-binding protein
MKRRTALAALFAGVLPSGARAQHHTMQSMPAGDVHGVLVFAAATLKPALDPIVAGWKAKGGGEVTVAYGPSPALAKQIENGAPADLFVSADPIWMDYLADAKLVRRHTRADLVRNGLVLAGREQVARAAVIDRSFPLAQVVGQGPLAMCNPADRPAGRYRKAALESLGLWDQVSTKIAIVDNPQVAVTMVARGDAPAAIVFATDVKDVAGARVLGTFAEASHPPIVYPIALTMAAPRAEPAEHLLQYLRSPDVRAQFDRAGYK